MESDNGMKELMLSLAAISAENQTIKAEPFSGKQEDYPKWRLKQKQLFIFGEHGTCFGTIFPWKVAVDRDVRIE